MRLTIVSLPTARTLRGSFSISGNLGYHKLRTATPRSLVAMYVAAALPQDCARGAAALASSVGYYGGAGTQLCLASLTLRTTSLVFNY